jgi:hypothetical protein
MLLSLSLDEPLPEGTSKPFDSKIDTAFNKTECADGDSRSTEQKPRISSMFI